MKIRRFVRRYLEEATGLNFVRFLPRGFDLQRDLRKAVPWLDVRVVLDVGANIGQSAITYLEAYPQSIIHCFEPVDVSYKALERRFLGEPRVVVHRLALAAESGLGVMRLSDASDTCSLLREGEETSGEIGSVSVASLDEFCAHHHLTKIDVLKIDTEGGDLDVLRGARRMLSSSRIGVVQVEAGMHDANARHVPFASFVQLLEAEFGYRLFGIYDQVDEMKSKMPILRRVNPVWVSPTVIATSIEMSR